MADTKKYVSEFEIQSNIDEALKQLQKYYVEFTKMPNVVESFNKALKKSTELEKSFIDMMSAIPKTMKRLSELSKIELIPRKELEKISDAVQLISSASKNLEGKSVFDVNEVKKVVSEFDKVVLELSELEAKHDKIITKAESYNKLVTEASKLQKNLSVNSEKFSRSSNDVYRSYTGVKSLLSRVVNDLKKAKDEGRITKEFMEDYDEKLKSVRKKVVNLGKEQESAAKRIEKVSSEIEGLLEGSTRFVNNLSSATGKISFGNSVVELSKMQKELEKIQETGKYSEESIEQYGSRVEEVSRSLGKAKDVFLAIDTVLGSANDIAGEMKNSIARTSYENTVDQVKSLRDELQRVLSLPSSSTDVEKLRLSLLEAQNDQKKKKIELEKLEASVIEKNKKLSEVKKIDPKVKQPEIDPQEIEIQVKTDTKKLEDLKKQHVKTQQEIIDRQKQYDEVSKKQITTDIERNEKIVSIKKSLDDSVESLNLSVAANERLVAETKTTNDAFNLMTRMTSDIYEEMQDISNVELKRMFVEAHNKIKQMNGELERMILVEKASNQAVREKMGLLKNEGDKLREIVNRQQEIKKLEEQSIAATVRRAREQDKINMAYARQILSQRKGIGGLVDAWKVYKSNIPNKAMATFGETGVVAAKGISVAFKALSAVFAPLMALGSGLAFIKAMFEAERQVKSARKQLFMMAMDTNTVRESFDTLSRGGQLVNTQIEGMVAGIDGFSKGIDSLRLINMGVNLEQAIDAIKEFQKQGFKATTVYENLTDISGGMFGTAASLGMEIGEVASRAGNLRTEFGYSLSETGKAFEQLRDDAKTAGVSVSIFFDKVMNASVGLALWGQKIDLISDVFANLVKNMKLPEAVSTKIADNMVKGFSNLSTEMQITTFQLGKGKALWAEYSAEQEKAINERVSNIDKEIEGARAAGNAERVRELQSEKYAKLREKRTLSEKSSLKGLSGDLEKARSMDVGRQIMMQLNLAGKDIGVNFGANIETLNDQFNRNFFEMEKMGEVVGIDRDTMKGYKQIVSTLADNVKGFKGAASGMKIDNVKNLIDALGNKDKTAGSIESALNGLKINGEEASKDDLKNFALSLAKQDEFLEYQESLLKAAQQPDPAAALAPILQKIDTKFGISAKQTKDALDASNAEAAKRAGVAMMQQTRSTEDAINNTVTKFIRDIFRVLEKFVSMFGFVNRESLKQFNTLSDRLDANRKVADQSLDALRSQKGDVQAEIVRLEQTTPKNEEEKTFRDEQLKTLKSQLGLIDSALGSAEKLNTAISETSTSLSKEGGITEKVEGKAKETDFTAVELSDALSKVNEGWTSIKAQKTKYSDQITQNVKPIESKYQGSEFGKEQGWFGKKKTVLENYSIPIDIGKKTIASEPYVFDSKSGKYSPKQQQAPYMFPQVQQEVVPEEKTPVKEETKKSGVTKVKNATLDIKKADKAILNAGTSQITSNSSVGNFKGKNDIKVDGGTLVVNKPITEEEATQMMSDKQQEAWKSMNQAQKIQVLRSVPEESIRDQEQFQKQVTAAMKNAGIKGFTKGGVVPGTSFKGDKVLSALNSGELVVPETAWQNAISPSPDVGKKSLQFLIDSMKIETGSTTTTTNVRPTDNKTINDNRVINISVNQSDRKQIEQIVLNAIYTDKMK